MSPTYFYTYPRPRFRFYPEEIRDIIVAVGTLTFCFWNIIGGLRYPLLIIPAFIAVITGFFLHEMAHKYMAFRFGYPAAFRAWHTGLFFALITSFFGFLFAAPGAVYIYGYPTKRDNGIISAAGPITNLSAGAVMLLVWSFSGFAIFYYLAYLNFFLAFFNLIPFGPMDGLKIIRWNVYVFIALFLAAIGGLILLSISF